MPVYRCPICNRVVRGPASNPAFPFCSERCRGADLFHWLAEEYTVPVRTERVAAELTEDDPEGPSGHDPTEPSWN